KPGADDLVGPRIGVRDPARHLPRMHESFAHKTENRNRPKHRAASPHAIARLLLAFGKIDSAPVQTGWFSSLEPALRKLKLLEPCRQRNGRRISGTPSRIVIETNMNAAI